MFALNFRLEEGREWMDGWMTIIMLGQKFVVPHHTSSPRLRV